MPYTAAHPPVPTSDELRARIPGWGVDLDPADRPSVPKLKPVETGARWDFPERQPENWPRERSIEHKFLTPVFGTSTPPRGLSGMIRRYSYRNYSEGRAAHWLLLILADRVDAVEHHLGALLSLRPDNPVTETGVRTELEYDGLAARLKSRRADTNHMWLDPLIVAGPWVATAGAGVLAARRLRRGRR
ncbi:hypothetical protein [Mycobacterium sp. E740]|uniref:hypothetical protein n=1 Tax=Mycobacterium sp. E740 TaxID=1834149 RepID=UPI0007FD9CC5|nr:hypothetical protein [Mycobacterium sp. E740]OBI77568.1 hypothetical protein A5663_21855 [Mycobacterium sp. E740]